MSTRITLLAGATLVCALAMLPAVWAQVPTPDAENAAQTMVDQARLSTAMKLRLRESGVLYVFTDAASGKKAWLPAACQPAKGEQVKLTEFNANVGGVRGVNSARITVTEERCQGTDGWVGTTYLDATQ